MYYLHKALTLLDFTVVRCPDDPELRQPLFQPGARFQWHETAGMLHDGTLPAASILSHKGRRYMVYNRSLYIMHGEEPAEHPAFTVIGRDDDHVRLVIAE